MAIYRLLNGTLVDVNFTGYRLLNGVLVKGQASASPGESVDNAIMFGANS